MKVLLVVEPVLNLLTKLQNPPKYLKVNYINYIYRYLSAEIIL